MEVTLKQNRLVCIQLALFWNINTYNDSRNPSWETFGVTGIMDIVYQQKFGNSHVHLNFWSYWNTRYCVSAKVWKFPCSLKKRNLTAILLILIPEHGQSNTTIVASCASDWPYSRIRIGFLHTIIAKNPLPREKNIEVVTLNPKYVQLNAILD